MERKELSINELRSIELEILEELDNFCENNNLSYFLASGSLLGAVRHQGFIPWDDDIDVFVPRKDYETLLKRFNDADPHYRILCTENTNNYPYGFAKIIDTTTKIKEFDVLDYNGGVFIDIFPIDYLGDDIDKILLMNKKVHLYRRLLHVKSFLQTKKKGKIKNLLIGIAHKLPFLKLKSITKRINKLAQNLGDEKSKYCGDIVEFTYKQKEIFRVEWFASYVKLPFENNFFRAPVDYDKVLSSMYGDYMKLPPEEKRVTRHNFIAWKMTDGERV